MLLILCRIIILVRLAQALAVGLVVTYGAFLAACGDYQGTQTTEGTRPTAAVAVAPVNSQPTQKAARPGTTSTGAGAAGSSLSSSPVKVVPTANFVGGWARI